jgi:hypothetical protein
VFPKRHLAAVVFAGALATSVAVQAAGARQTTSPRTLLKTTKSIRAFAQDVGHIA